LRGSRRASAAATCQFAQLCQASGRATLLGEATGGNRRGINGGAHLLVRLPRSGPECDLPLIGYFPEQPQPDAGIEPGIPVPVRAADIAAGADRQMEAAIARLQSTLP
jgi:C-terminal processing protease CtpA/Prc